MRLLSLSKGLIAVVLTFTLAAPSSSYALTAQQQLMTDCNRDAGDMRGQKRKQFMHDCLSAKPPTALYCSGGGKRCGNACIAANEVCHQK